MPILAGSGQAAIDAESIVAILTFDEGRDEDVKDVSCSGNDGFLLGKPKWVDGQFRTALDFASLSGVVAQIVEFDNVAPAKEATITVLTKLGDAINCDIVNFNPLAGNNRFTIHFPWGNSVLCQHGTD